MGSLYVERLFNLGIRGDKEVKEDEGRDEEGEAQIWLDGKPDAQASVQKG